MLQQKTQSKSMRLTAMIMISVSNHGCWAIIYYPKPVFFTKTPGYFERSEIAVAFKYWSL